MPESPPTMALKKQKHSHCCISHEFFHAATANPYKVAVIHASGWAAKIRTNSADASPPPSPPVYDEDKCFTFAEVLSSVNSLSSRLRSILDGGDDADDPYLIKPRFRDVELYGEAGGQATHVGLDTYMPKVLGVYMPPSVEYIVSVLSIMRCGEAFLPLDPSWPRQRILSAIYSSNVSLVIACGSSFNEVGSQPLERSHWLVGSNICPILFFSMRETFCMETAHSGFLWPCQKERQRAFCYVMFTSGSTGKPKGVCGTEQGLLNRFLWMQEFYPIVMEERLAFKTSISFVDHLQEFLGSILTSIPLVVPPFNLLKEKMFSVVDFLEAYSISRLIAVPSMMRAILPTLQSHGHNKVQSSLKLLILSGELFPLTLWDALHSLLPHTCILNLYGSTEVSGDCTYFDCRRLPELLESESVDCVPIGMPISNCDVVLFADGHKANEGEIFVGGICVSSGYLHTSAKSDDYVKMHGNSICNHSTKDCGSQLYFRTGDFGQRLASGDLVFVGRRDRTIKLNGQRIALEEIEITLRFHPDVDEVVVVLQRDTEELASLEAFLVLNKKAKSDENIIYSIRNWLVDRLPSVMVPSHFVLLESLPISSAGKVDYESLASLRHSRTPIQDIICPNETKDLMEAVRKGFCDALVVKEVSDDDDFFAIGGDSLAAAHLSHSLGIDMRLVYKFPSPSKLTLALLEKKELLREGIGEDLKKLETKEGQNNINLDSGVIPVQIGGKSNSSPTYYENWIPLKRMKIDPEKYAFQRTKSENPWSSQFDLIEYSVTRCNKVWYADMNKQGYECQVIWSVELPRDRMVSMRGLWKVHMKSCVDASPLVVFKHSDIYIFIGSHSYKFLCIDAKSGSICWETILEGRIEGSATVVDDFSQVVVGCYKGKIYFLDLPTGNVCWIFQANGEVKCQPVVDASWHLIWCGSHDHTLYALDYKKHQCVYKLQCHGSIFGSPVIDEERGSVYVASTGGCVTALSIRAFPFYTTWLLELGAPIFGSLSLNLRNGSVICCLVDGQVVALSPSGTITWRYNTGGPIFAGPCMSHVLPSQVLICSRTGSVYSLESEHGRLIWEYNVSDPIVASAYVDENLHLKSDCLPSSDRLVCVCSGSGKVHVLRVNSNITRSTDESKEDMVQEIAKFELEGEIFSSPVMIGGRIFVGCRDDYLHCISLECL